MQLFSRGWSRPWRPLMAMATKQHLDGKRLVLPKFVALVGTTYGELGKRPSTWWRRSQRGIVSDWTGRVNAPTATNLRTSAKATAHASAKASSLLSRKDTANAYRSRTPQLQLQKTPPSE